MQDFDEEMAGHLADAIPSASFVGFEVQSDNGPFTMWWHVDRGGDRNRVEQIPVELNSIVEDIIFGADASTDIQSQGKQARVISFSTLR